MCLGKILLRTLVSVPKAALVEVPGAQIVRPVRARPLALGLAKLGLDCTHQRCGDFVLNGENIFQLAVVALGPDMVARQTVNQLRRDTNALAGLANTAFEHIGHAQCPGNFADVGRLPLIREAGIAGDYEEPSYSRQRGDQILGDPVGKILLVRVAGHVGKRQNCNRRFVGQLEARRWSPRTAGRGCACVALPT